MDMLLFFYEEDDLEVIDLVLYGIPRRVNIRPDYFHSLSDMEFFQRFRLRKETVLDILILIENDLEFIYDV